MQQLSSTWVHFFILFLEVKNAKKHKNTIDIFIKKAAKISN